MTCKERQDLILLYAADALDDAAERQELRAHLAGGCPACAASLAEAQEVIAHLPLALPRQAVSAGARDQLMQRVLATATAAGAATGTSTGPPTVSHRDVRPSRLVPRTFLGVRISTVAAVIAVVMAVQFQRVANDYRAQLADAKTQMTELSARNVQTDREIARLQVAVAQANEQGEIWKARSLQLVAINNAGPQPDAWGRVIWDKDHDKWHVNVFQLKSLPADKVYQLWFLTPDGAKPAPTFQVNAQGHAVLAMNVPKNIGAVNGAGITIENVGGAQTPTLPIQLAGTVSTQ